jgi:hypothetical protein
MLGSIGSKFEFPKFFLISKAVNPKPDKTMFIMITKALCRSFYLSSGRRFEGLV